VGCTWRRVWHSSVRSFAVDAIFACLPIVTVRNPSVFCPHEITEAPQGGTVSASVEASLLPRVSSEQAIEEEKADAEVLVHESLVGNRPVVNIVGAPRAHEPEL